MFNTEQWLQERTVTALKDRDSLAWLAVGGKIYYDLIHFYYHSIWIYYHLILDLLQI